MHVHVGRKKRHAVQPSVRCCLPANGTSPKYSSTLSVDMLLSDSDTLDSEPLDALSDPPVGNCSRSSSVSVSMSRDLRLYTYWQISAIWRRSEILSRLKYTLQILQGNTAGKGTFSTLRFPSLQYLPWKTRILMIMLLDLWQLRFTICPRPLLLWTYIAVITKLSTFVFYTRIFTVDIKIPLWAASRRVASSRGKSHDGKMKPILSRWKFIETKRLRAGTREICHVNRRENKYAWST